MKLVVYMKEVPDTEANIRIGADKKSIVEENVTFIMNPYDEYAVEEALKIKEAKGGETTAVCIGKERADEVLRSALAMGMDHPIRIQGDSTVLDGLSHSKMLAKVLKDVKFDILLMGKETIDDGSKQIGPMLGELLNLPCITLVTRLEVGEGKLTAERAVEGGTEVVEASFPCIITAQKGLNEPRYPSLRGKMMAKKAAIEVREAASEESRVKLVSIQYPPARGESKVVGESVEAVPELIRLLREESKVI